MMVTIENLKGPRPFYERTRVHNMQLRVNELRREIAELEGNAEKARIVNSIHEAIGLEKRLPALKKQLNEAEHHLDVAATEEAKRQHDEAMEAERARELDEFYAEERANEQKRFETWRKRKHGP